MPASLQACNAAVIVVQKAIDSHDIARPRKADIKKYIRAHKADRTHLVTNTHKAVMAVTWRNMKTTQPMIELKRKAVETL